MACLDRLQNLSAHHAACIHHAGSIHRAKFIRPAILLSLLLLLLARPACARQMADSPPPTQQQQIDQLRSMVLRLQERVDALEQQAKMQPANGEAPAVTSGAPSPMPQVREVAANVPPAPPHVQPAALISAPQESAAAAALPATLPGGATLNFALDGYYEFNPNRPPGRVNYLRAYDVLSNAFSLNQADVVLALDPDVGKGRRFGARLDLQFGQATASSQGNPANEPRPEVYRNLYQAYGTYVVPLGNGLTVDFGKWASSLGGEGNYTKDQMNYTRSFFFYFLPFYHQGVRASYAFNGKLRANYWLVNGTNQSEPSKGYKDEMLGFVLTPTKSLTWTSNYYLGKEHADFAQSSTCPAPVQPGLCVTALSPVPNGKLHIFNNYATWQASSKFTLQGEFDYFLQRQWASAAPGQSSAPSHVVGGVAWAQYQVTRNGSLAARAEYLSDRQGLFSGRSQALKESTVTYKYNFAGGFDGFLEYRADWSNQPYFVTHTPGSLVQHQQTATVGLVWWYGGKQGAW